MRETEHFSPETLDEVAALLMTADFPLPPLVEGSRLVLHATDGRRPCAFVVNLNRVPELNRLDYDERLGLRIGAAVPYADLLEFPPVRPLFPILADACMETCPGETERLACSWATLMDSDGFPDILAALVCLRASATIFGPHGWSELGIEAWLTGTGKTRLQHGEFVVDLRLSPPPPRSGGVYLSLDWAQGKPFDPASGGTREMLTDAHEATKQPAIGIAAFLVMEQDLATCCGGRLVFATATRKACRALEAERFLAGKRLDAVVVRKAADLVLQDAQREGKDGTMKKDLIEGIGGLARRAILEALARARAAAPSADFRR